MMNGKIWAAIPLGSMLLLIAAAAVLVVGNRRTSVPPASSAAALSSSAGITASSPSSLPASNVAQQAPARPQQVGAPAAKPASNPASKPAGKSAASAPQAPASTVSKQAPAQPASAFGWKVGTEWTVGVEEYASYLAQPRWVSTEYRFRVIAAEPASHTFTVSVRFADPSTQPQSAQGDMLRAGYTLRQGNLELAWVQPEGRGPKLSPAEAEGIVGSNFISLQLPKNPMASGTRVQASVPSLGKVAAQKVSLSKTETATFAKGAPWWVSYAKGNTLRARLTGFTR